MVEAGFFINSVRLPAWEINRAPTRSPTNAVRLGAMARIRLERYEESSLRYSVKPTTWSARMLMCSRSSDVISVPIDTSAAALMASSISSGRMSDKSVLEALLRMPIARMTRA